MKKDTINVNKCNKIGSKMEKAKKMRKNLEKNDMLLMQKNEVRNC